MDRSLRVLVWMLGLIWFPAVKSQQPIQTLLYNNSLNFVSGTFAEYLPDPIFYDTFLPLLYEFPMPKHMENALKLLWDHATVCNASDSRYDGKLCPVVHHLHKVVANLSQDMGFWKDFLPESFPQSDISSSSVKVIPHCDEIAPHFSNYYSTEDQLHAYLKYLEKCPFGQNMEVISQPHTWIMDKQIYYTMMERFYSEFYRSLPGQGNIDWVVTLNSYTAIQGVLLANNYMESNRLKTAFMTCQNGRIPESFIKTTMLQEALKSLKAKVYSKHFKFLWEKDGDLSMYYKLPLTDCVFVDDYKLVVRVLIPVKVTDVDAKLLQLKTFPFVERFLGNTKSSPVEKSEITDQSSGKIKLCMLSTLSNMKVVETNSGLLFETNCKPNELCKSSELDSFLPTDICTSAVAMNNEELIAKHCAIKCFSIDRKSLPIIRRKSSDTFVAVGISEDKIFINCNGQPLEKFNLKNVGALEIKLPCNCQISYGYQTFRPSEECSNDDSPSVKHILPFQWNKWNISHGDSGKNSTLEIEENLILDGLEKDEEMKQYAYQTEGGDGPIQGNNEKNRADKQIYVEPTSGPYSTGFLIQICLLWILVVILVLTNICLVYQMYVLMQWKKVQVYKDTRIVYSVPSSPQFTSKF
jgi:hypothetical protein